ncbi:hypothetical protein ACFE04_001047 [Oxalis oulophora]
MSRKALKICILVTIILLILIVATLLILYFTLLKPKSPQITPQPATLENLRVIFFPVIELNVTLGIVVTISNPNYGSFTYNDGTTYVNYRGILVAESPIKSDTIPARAEHNISLALTVYADKLAVNRNFLGDVHSGVLNFTSTTTLKGKVRSFKLFKAKATSLSSCNISVYIQAKMADTICKSQVKL